MCYSGGPFKDLGLAGACIAAPVDGFVHAALALVYELLSPDALALALLAVALALPLAKGRLLAADLAGHVAFVGVVCGVLGLTGATYPCYCLQALGTDADKAVGQEIFAADFLVDPVLTACVLVGCVLAGFVDLPLGLALALSSIPVSICVGASSILSALLALCVDTVLLLEFYFAPFGVRLALVIISVGIAVAISALGLDEEARDTLSQITRSFALHIISFLVTLFSVSRANYQELLRTGARRYPGVQEWKREKKKRGEVEREDENGERKEEEMQPLVHLKGLSTIKAPRSRWSTCWLLISLLLVIILCGAMRLSIHSEE